jgi:hypothetical protein
VRAERVLWKACRHPWKGPAQGNCELISEEEALCRVVSLPVPISQEGLLFQADLPWAAASGSSSFPHQLTSHNQCRAVMDGSWNTPRMIRPVTSSDPSSATR